MDTLLLREGDLVVSSQDYALNSGTGKIAQDLRGALLEPLGNDRFHTYWGSTLQQFVAQIADETSRSQVEAEVNRIITNYVAVQRDAVQADISSDGDTRFTTDDILSRITSVAVATNHDAVDVVVHLKTVSGETVIVSGSVI